MPAQKPGRFSTSHLVCFVFVLFLTIIFAGTLCHAANPPACSTGILPQGNGGDIDVTGGTCYVDASNSPYNYGNINIYGAGTLCFVDRGEGKNIDFWVKNILVEDNGSLLSSDATQCAGGKASVFGGGAKPATLTIHLYGPDQGPGKNGAAGPGQGILCHSGRPGATHCGIPDTVWGTNTPKIPAPPTCTKSQLPGNVNDCFYNYDALIYDTKQTNEGTVGYFGYKVLGVSYNGTLQLFGAKGATYSSLKPSQSGTSWARLAADANPGQQGGGKTLTLDRKVDWVTGDKIVVTTTDYLPAHSEQRQIAMIDNSSGVSVITLTTALKYPHNGTTFDTSAVPDGIGPDKDPNGDPNFKCSGAQTKCIETRAAVGLLTRSISIVSEGDSYNTPLPAPGSQCTNPPDPMQPNSCQYFGGHTIVRQGFAAFQMQGVEFRQLGQGARIMHYPVHFHMARQTPQPDGNEFLGTFVADSSIWDSMTRWITIHATEGVTLSRNVGYMSIGHGFYLEDGDETENRLYSNLGVLARAAVENGANQQLNPRKVPGILSGLGHHYDPGNDEVPFHADADHPTVFWITNGWNDFQYNMAAGATACGMCYWLPPTMNSGASRGQHFDSYAGEQWYQTLKLQTPGDDTCKSDDRNQSIVTDDDTRAGISPLMNFVGNSCTAAQNSLITVGNTAPCYGVTDPNNASYPRMRPIFNDLAPDFPYNPKCKPFTKDADNYYPKVAQVKGRQATVCPGGKDDNCAGAAPPCAYDAVSDPGMGQEAFCTATVIDHYTSSFTWADTNVASIWLRPQWYLVSNSAITDAQNGGLTFVSGGGYTGADEIRGYWALAHKDVFVGNTQSNTKPFTMNAGPFNGLTGGLKCDPALNTKYCLNKDEGMVMPLSNFAINQRLFNIYDGPAFESANAYLDISPTYLTDCKPGDQGSKDCQNAGWMYGRMPGVLIDSQATKDQCYLPNAAIGWKQPNAFYYPPAFHSDQLFFKDVATRHFVIEPLFHPGTYTDWAELISQRYCTPTTFSPDYTDIDRQTELSDDDGSLTGLLGSKGADSPATSQPSISVNKDAFFKAPVETAECASDIVNNMPAPDPPGGMCTYSDPKSGEALCATANTSPYHYVTTVEFPCVWPDNKGPDGAPNGLCCKDNGHGSCVPTCGDGGTGQAECWANACENEHCFGVPLYREDKNPNETSAPFIKMAGQATFQRSTLTLDHGTYFMDTSVSWHTQQNASPPGDQKNVFAGGYTYATFLLYAEPGTKQTYQYYVGTDFNTATLILVRVHWRDNPPKFDTGDPIAQCSDKVKSQCYMFDTSKGYLTVILDMSQISTFAKDYDDAKAEHCAPVNYCHWDGKSCGCAHGNDDECSNACSNWAVKDVNCPNGGCYGFEFKLPDGFVAKDQAMNTPPQFKCFNPDPMKGGDAYWDTLFAEPTQSPGSQCDYKMNLPGRTLCTDGSLSRVPGGTR